MGFKDAGKPHYLGHRERLRRRFRDAGADAVPDYELLELIPFRAAPRRDTKPLAKALLARFGTFADPGHVLGILAKNGKLLQHEADLGVSLDLLGEVWRASAAIGAVIVEEGDDAHIAFRVAGDEARGRGERKISSAWAAIPLSCRRERTQERPA